MLHHSCPVSREWVDGTTAGCGISTVFLDIEETEE